MDFQTTLNCFLVSQNIQIDTWFVILATRVAELSPFPPGVSWFISTSLWHLARKRHGLCNEKIGTRELQWPPQLKCWLVSSIVVLNYIYCIYPRTFNTVIILVITVKLPTIHTYLCSAVLDQTSPLWLVQGKMHTFW